MSEEPIAQAISFTTLDGIVSIEFLEHFVTLRFLSDETGRETDIHMPLNKFQWAVDKFNDAYAYLGE